MGLKCLYETAPGKTLNLPYDVPANEFLNLEGQKISGSRNWAVWGLDAVSRYDADALRYYLVVNMPESRDTDWSWSEFVARNNNELVATWGNLVNRVLSFTYKNFEGRIPAAALSRPEDAEILAKVEEGFSSVGSLIAAVKHRAALAEAMRVTTLVNRYIDMRAPWTELKTDRAAAAATLYTALKAINCLKIIFAPFIPFSSDKLHEYLGFEGSIFGAQKIITVKECAGSHTALTYEGAPDRIWWQTADLPQGQAMRPPAPLFKKLEQNSAAQELARLGG